MTIYRDLVAWTHTDEGREVAGETQIGFKLKTLSGIIHIESAPDGAIKGTPTMTFIDPDEKVRALMPHVKRSVNVEPALGDDTVDYLFGGFVPMPNDSEAKISRGAERAEKLHEAAVALARRWSDETDSPIARTVVDFMEGDWGFDLTNTKSRSNPYRLVVNGEVVTETAEFRTWWSDYMSRDLDTGICWACDREAKLVRLLTQVTIPGASTTGTTLSTIDKTYAESWGRKAAADICVDCDSRISKAITGLARSRDHQRIVGGRVILWWSMNHVTESLIPNLISGDLSFGDLVKMAENGLGGNTDLDALHVLVLKPNAGRTSIYGYQTITFEQMVDRFAEWSEIATVDEVNYPLWKIAKAIPTNGTSDPLPGRFEAEMLTWIMSMSKGFEINPAVIRRIQNFDPKPLTGPEIILLNAYLKDTMNEQAEKWGEMFFLYAQASFRANGSDRTILSRYRMAMRNPRRAMVVLEPGFQRNLQTALSRGRPSTFLAKRMAELSIDLGELPSNADERFQSAFVLGFHSAKHAHFQYIQQKDSTDDLPE